MITAQISDLHVAADGGLVYERFDTSANLARCIEHIRRMKPAPDVLLATGDLVRDGTAREYETLRELLSRLAMPVYLIPGNHDERGALRAAFPDHAYLLAGTGPVHYAVETFPVRLLALDTSVPGATGGELDVGQLAWLDAQLAASPHRPTLIFMHHPPFRTGIPHMDRIGLDAENAERFGAIVSRHRQIERVTCGHVHRDIRARWNGVVVSICPSTAFQYNLDLAAEGLEPTDEPAAFQLHAWNGAELVTHTIAVTGDL